MLRRDLYFKAISREEVRLAVAAAVAAAVRADIRGQLAHHPMTAEESLTVEGLLFDIMYPEALQATTQHLLDAGLADSGDSLRAVVALRKTNGVRDEEWVAGVKAHDARKAGFIGRPIL
jgi:hypothetical protein